MRREHGGELTNPWTLWLMGAIFGRSIQMYGAPDVVAKRFVVRVVKSEAGDRELDDFVTVTRARPG